MPITTTSQVKAILGITTTDQDAQIDALIPEVEAHYLALRNKPFDNATKLTVETTGMSADEEMIITVGNYAAVGSTADGIEYDIRLRSGDTAGMIAKRIVAQMLPSPYYKVTTTVTGSTSTSADIYFSERFSDFLEDFSVLDLSVSASPRYTTSVSPLETIYPDGAPLTAAKMVAYNMGGAGGGITEERLGDYSVSYASEDGYPRAITSGIQKFVTFK